MKNYIGMFIVCLVLLLVIFFNLNLNSRDIKLDDTVNKNTPEVKEPEALNTKVDKKTSDETETKSINKISPNDVLGNNKTDIEIMSDYSENCDEVIVKKIMNNEYNNVNEYSINECVKEVAVNERSTVICDQLNESSKTDCYTGVAVETQDISICNSLDAYNPLKANSSKENCKFAVAKVTNNIKNCGEPYQESVTNAGLIYYQTQCYKVVAKQTKNADYCEYIGKLGAKEDCYLNIVKLTFDKDICDKISNERKNALCITMIE